MKECFCFDGTNALEVLGDKDLKYFFGDEMEASEKTGFVSPSRIVVRIPVEDREEKHRVEIIPINDEIADPELSQLDIIIAKENGGL